MKKWIARIVRSKMMIFSMLLSLGGVLQENTGFLQSILTPNQFGYLMICIGCITAILRFYTTQPLCDK